MRIRNLKNSKLKYLIRLDDACPTMDVDRWNRVECILDRYSIRPMVGVIPHNEDPTQNISPEDKNFWNKVRSWGNKGWAIALHGYNHCYTSSDAGINPLWNRSEFAGLPLKEQKEKIRSGIAILKSHNIYPKFFFAPSHTFDENTLIALREESEIRIISDTIAVKPYKRNDFIFIPQLGGSCKNMYIPGVWTFCLHPSVMSEEALSKFETFLQKNAHKFSGFDDSLIRNVKPKSIFSKFMSFIYFTLRKLKGIS